MPTFLRQEGFKRLCVLLTEIGRLRCTSHKKEPRPNVFAISKVGIDLINPRYLPATYDSDSTVGLDISLTVRFSNSRGIQRKAVFSTNSTLHSFLIVPA